MKTYPMSVGALKKVVHVAAMDRYGLTGEQFIRLVQKDLMTRPGSEDLVRIVKNYILT